MPLVVHHYYPLGSDNVGDHVVAHAIRNAVIRHFGPAEFVYFPVNDTYKAGDRLLGLRGQNLERTNAEADLVIIGGSNLLEPRKPHRENGWFRPRVGRWSVFTDLDSIQQLRKPVMLLGMGNGSSFGKPMRPYCEPAASEIRLLHQKAFAHAVRDQKTVDMLATIGVHTRCVGCPVTFLTPAPVAPAPADLPLAVSFPPIAILRRRFGPSFMRQTMRYLAWLQAQHIPTLVTLHDARDREPARELVPPGLEIFYTADPEELTGRLQQCRGMIGFRLHAALHALGLGRPVIPVGIDWRGLAFIQTYGFQDISIRSMRWGQFAVLRALTRRLLADDPSLIARLNEGKMKYLARYEQFLAEASAAFAAQASGRAACAISDAYNSR